MKNNERNNIFSGQYRYILRRESNEEHVSLQNILGIVTPVQENENCYDITQNDKVRIAWQLKVINKFPL